MASPPFMAPLQSCDHFFHLRADERDRCLGYFAASATVLAAAVGLAVHFYHRRAAALARRLATTRTAEATAQAVEAATATAQAQAQAATATVQAQAQAAAQAAATAEARVAQVLDHLAASQARVATLERELDLLRRQHSSVVTAAERRIHILERKVAVAEEGREVQMEISSTTYALYEKASAEVTRLRGLLAAGLEPGSSETPGGGAPRAADVAGAPPGEAPPATTTEANNEAESEGYFSASSRRLD